MTPVILLHDAQLARSAGNLVQARELLKSAIGMDRTLVDGWEGLAEVQEEMGQWGDAVDSWTNAANITRDAARRQRNIDRLRRANDEHVIIKLKGAEEAAQKSDFAKSLTILLDCAADKPSARILDRVQSRYFVVLGAWFRTEIVRSAGASQWKSLGVATFSGTSESEGISVRDRICAALADTADMKTQVFSISDEGAKELQRGQYERVPKKDRRRIAELGVDAVVFGYVGRKLRAYVHDLRSHETRPLLSVTPISRVPGLPSSISTWSRLPAKTSTNRGLRVEVWTEKSAYTIGDEVVFHLRATQDCYITLIDLQSSGGLYVLFPNAHQEDNFVRGGRVYSVPASTSEFTINAGGPPGMEGIKAIATKKKLSLPRLGEGQKFVALRTPTAQTEFSTAIDDSVHGMREEDWDIAEWIFQIRN